MGTFDHVAFQVSDMEASIEFFVEKLGFQQSFRALNEEHGEEYAFFTYGDLRLELIRDIKQPSFNKPDLKPPYCPHLALETQDMQQTLARLEAAGVPILRGPLEIPGEETWVYFADPDNNVLEYIQWYQKK
jgi:lactoylglutathione lyase